MILPYYSYFCSLMICECIRPLWLTVGYLDQAWCEYDLNVCEHDLDSSGPQAQYPGILSRARGQGTFCAVDICDDATRNSILLKARDKGMKPNRNACFHVHVWTCQSHNVTGKMLPHYIAENDEIAQTFSPHKAASFWWSLPACPCSHNWDGLRYHWKAM